MKDKVYLSDIEEVVDLKFCFCDRCVLLGECVETRGMKLCKKCYKELYTFN